MTLFIAVVSFISGGVLGVLLFAVLAADRNAEESHDIYKITLKKEDADLWIRLNSKLLKDGWTPVTIKEREPTEVQNDKQESVPGTATSEDIELSLNSYEWYSKTSGGQRQWMNISNT